MGGDGTTTGGRISKTSFKDGHQTIQITTKSETIALSRNSSAAAGAFGGGDSAGLTEELSSEDPREGGEDDRSSMSPVKKVSSRKTKDQGRKQKRQKSGTRGDMLSPSYGGYSSGGDRISQQSAFPISTPDRLGPLSDLLEEEIVLPGESRDTSASTDGRGGAVEKEGPEGPGAKKKKGQPNWAYLPPPRSPTTSTTSSESYVVRRKLEKKLIQSYNDRIILNYFNLTCKQFLLNTEWYKKGALEGRGRTHKRLSQKVP